MPGASLQLSAHLVQALLWIAYFTLHSYLASEQCKTVVARRWPRWHAHYRLVFNGVSLILLVPVLALVHAVPGPLLWDRPPVLDWLCNLLALIALAVAWRSGRAYDMRAFIGLPAAPASEAFGISPVHRYVRHPWYACALVLLWTRPLDLAMTLTALIATIYLYLGARLEDAKLTAAYGDAYARYMARVPGLFPRPGRTISAEDADALTRKANENAAEHLSRP